MRRAGEISCPAEVDANAGMECKTRLSQELTIEDWRQFSFARKPEQLREFDNPLTIVKAEHGIENINPTIQKYFEALEHQPPKQPDDVQRVDDFCKKTGRSLGRQFEEASRTGNFEALNAELSRQFNYAYRVGGMEAVEKLEFQINEHTRQGAGVVVTKSWNSSRIHRPGGWYKDVSSIEYRACSAEKVSESEGELASKMSEKQLRDANLFRHPTAGWLRVVDKGALLSFDSQQSKNAS